MSRPGTGARIGLAVVLAAVLATAVVVARRGDAPGRTDGAPAAASVAAPVRGPLLAPPGDAPVPAPAALAKVVSRALADPALGGRIAASVVDAQTGEVLLDRRAAADVLPASTAKIATAVAVLSALDPTARLPTRVLAGAVPGEVVLVGSGDVTLAGPATRVGYPRLARLSDLAAQTRTALHGRAVTRVLVDDTAYAGPRLAPGWKPSYVTGGDVMPVDAVSVDEGRTSPGPGPRVADPGRAAGTALASALGARSAQVARGRAAAGAALLGEVQSPPVSQLVELMLTRSDNDLAESLSRQVALARHRSATFAGASEAVAEVLAGLPSSPAEGVVLVDGSGLSRQDRARPAALTRLLATAALDRSGRLAPVLSGLPVAGFDGTLEDRFRTGSAGSAAGAVRAKTGTLLDVSALAGLVRTADGRLLAFDLTADAVRGGATLAARAALDRLAGALASCGCR